MPFAALTFVAGLLIGAILAAVVLRRRSKTEPPAAARRVAEPAPEPDTFKLRPPPGPPAIPVTAAHFGPTDTAPHGLSIEEHVDIDQQAEFLVVIGQDEAAVDLLLDHLRGTGGTSPLPYLRLMQIYRRRGDQAAYERTRERFNQRFNALAPQWQDDATHGRTLADYPEALEQVQRAWHAPLDAMAVIEALLFRRGSEDERFDLPAYEELLFLYWLTRELQQQESKAPPSQVDVLLPFEDSQVDAPVIQKVLPAFDSTAVFTHAEVRRLPSGVDLDLSTVPADPEHNLAPPAEDDEDPR